MSLGVVAVQDDFSLGECPGIAPHLIPANGAFRMGNLLIDEDGSPYKRSGSTALTAAFGSTGLTFLWDGWLAAGQRTLLANKDDFAVIASNGTTIVPLGSDGLPAPAHAVAINGMLFIDGGYMYAGSRFSGSVSAGTVALTNGSATVTGTGTQWQNSIPAPDAGSILVVDNKPYVVQSVASDTSLTLTAPFAGTTVSGKSYTMSAIVKVSGDMRPGPYLVAGQRLLSLEGNRAYFSAYRDATTWNPTEDYHEITDGVTLLGGAPLGDTAALFTTRGIWTIGNLEYDIVDDLGTPQQPESREAQDLILWSKEGLAGWQDSLVVPAVDGVWLIGAGTFALISESIGPTYQEYVRKGYHTGLGTVMQAHYLLPILDLDGSFVDLLVCRLDRPVRVRGRRMWPWTHFSGEGVECSALISKVGSAQRSPVVLGAEIAAGSRVLKFGAFEHVGAATDQDGAAVIPDLVLRDIQTGPLNENVVKKIECRYELVDVDTDPAEPKLRAFYGTDARPVEPLWGAATWDLDYWPTTLDANFGFTELPAVGDASFGEQPKRWTIGKRMRYVRPRFTQDGGSSRTVFRHVRVLVRPSGRI